MKQYFITLFEYHQWSNRITAEAVAGCNSPAKAISIMSHIINANRIWLSRLRSMTSDTEVWKNYEAIELPVLAGNSDRALLEFVIESDPGNFDSAVSYANTRGEEFTSSVKDILTHVSNHSAYHRGQVVALLKGIAEPLPNTDYITYVRQITH